MLFQVVLFPEHFRLWYLGFMKASLSSLGYTCQVQSAYDGVLEYGFTHLFRVSRFPLGESRMLSKKKNKNLGLVNEGFSIHEVTVFFFKSEISCNILQPFFWLVTTGLKQVKPESLPNQLLRAFPLVIDVFWSISPVLSSKWLQWIWKWESASHQQDTETQKKARYNGIILLQSL